MNTVSLRSFLLLLVLCLALGGAHAQDKAAAPAPGASLGLGADIPLNPAVRTGKLDNGLTYYIRKNAKPEKRAELRLAVNAGSVLESDAQRGLAHFCEHMAFNGTKNFKKNELVQYLESVGVRFGADLNAYTSFDETVYMLQVPTDKEELLDKGLLVLYDWACGQLMESGEIDKERGVIVEERRQRSGADSRIRDKQFPVILAGSKYADRMPIGTEEVLKTFPYDTLRVFYTTWYRPDLQAVVAVGDFDVDAMEKKIKELFGAMPRTQNPVARPSYPVPDQPGTRVTIVTDPEATGNRLTLYTLLEPRVEEKVRDMREGMAYRLYGQMLNERLSELTLKADPPFLNAYGYRSNFMRTKDAAMLSVNVKDGGVLRGFEAAYTELLRVKQHGFTPTEFDRAKIDMLRSIEEQFDERHKTESGRHARELVGNFLDREPAPGIEIEYDLYKKYLPTITLKEINKLSEKMLLPNNRVVAVSGPEKKDNPMPTDKQILDLLAKVEALQLEPYVDKVQSKPLVETLPKPGKVVSESRIEQLGFTVWKLSNGVTVYVKPTDFKEDEILFSGYSTGGTSLVEDADFITADNAASVIEEGGLGDFDQMQLRKALTGKVANVSPGLDDNFELVNGSASPKDIRTMFELLWLTFTAPRKDTTAFASYKTRMRGYLQNMSNMPEMAFRDTLMVTVANHHPRQRPFTVATLDEINLDKALAVYTDRFGDAHDFTFVFVGNVVLDSLKPLVETWLGALPVKQRTETWKDRNQRPPRGVVERTVVKGIDPKSMVSVVYTGPFEWTMESRLRLTALKELLNIRLRESIREEKGGTYGVQVMANAKKLPNPEYAVFVVFGTKPERVDELSGTLLSVLDSVRSFECSADHLGKIREILKREREKRMKENGYWLGQVSSRLQNGDDPAEMLQYDGLLEQISAADILDMAKRCIDPKNVIKITLMPEKKADDTKKAEDAK